MSIVGYTKLFSDIVFSSVWAQPHHTKIVWITMLAMKDSFHIARTSIPGLAHVSGVTDDECREAIQYLESPDKDSRSSDFEGRRIEKCDEGYLILNGEKYRRILSADERREYKRNKAQEYRDRDKGRQKKTQWTQSEEDSKEEVKINLKKDLLSSDTKDHIELIAHLNEVTEREGVRKFWFGGATERLVTARLKEYPLKDLKNMCTVKAQQWLYDSKMSTYLRPKTLFNKSNCEEYIKELPTPKGGIT